MVRAFLPHRTHREALRRVRTLEINQSRLQNLTLRQKRFESTPAIGHRDPTVTMGKLIRLELYSESCALLCDLGDGG